MLRKTGKMLRKTGKMLRKTRKGNLFKVTDSIEAYQKYTKHRTTDRLH